MAEGTRFSKLEAATVELQKAQGLLDEKLGSMDSQMISLETTINGYKESFVNMEAMMRNMLQSQSVDSPTHGTAVQNQQEVNTELGVFAGKGLKVEVPRFNGTEAEDWVFKIKEIFEIYGVPMDQRIKIASFHMKGQAYAWYKWVVKNGLVQSWGEFLAALLLRFGTSLYDDPKAALKELKQKDTMTKYQTNFEEISTKVTGLNEQWLTSFFISGLQEHLKCELLLAQPTSYYQAVSLAKLHEQKAFTLQQTLKSTNSQPLNSMDKTRTYSGNTTYFLANNKPGSTFSPRDFSDCEV